MYDIINWMIKCTYVLLLLDLSDDMADGFLGPLTEAANKGSREGKKIA